jgi:hypothetical protein
VDERYLGFFSAKRCFSSLSGEASPDEAENLRSNKSFHGKSDRLLARIFHGLLYHTITLCARRSNIRAKIKTAERFCFSPQIP